MKRERGDTGTMKRSFTVRVGMLKEGKANDLWDSLQSRKLFASSNASRAAWTSVHLGGAASTPNKGSRYKKMNVDIVQNERCDSCIDTNSTTPLLLRPVHYSYRQLFRFERRLSRCILCTIITRLPSNAHSSKQQIRQNYCKTDLSELISFQ